MHHSTPNSDRHLKITSSMLYESLAVNGVVPNTGWSKLLSLLITSSLIM